MAKRQKKRKSQRKPRKKRSGTSRKGTTPASLPDLAAFDREKRMMMDLIQRKLSSGEFGGEEDINKMLAEFTGRPMSELIAENEPAELTAHDRALRHLDKIDQARSRSEARKIAETATGMEPECVEAWLELAATYDRFNLAEKHLIRAVDAGRSRYADLIALERGRDAGQSWLWGHVQARPFLEALRELACGLEIEVRLEEAKALFEEILELNFGDNQGVRFDYFRCLLTMGEAERVDDLLERYPDDESSEWLYLTALHRFIESAKVCDWKPDLPDDPEPSVEDLIASFRALPSDYDEANAAFDRAFEANRFAPMFLGDLRSLSLVVDSFRIGSPEEALNCAATVRFLWSAYSADIWAFARIHHAMGIDPWSDLLRGVDPEFESSLIDFDEELAEIPPAISVEFDDHCYLSQWVRAKVLGIRRAREFIHQNLK